MQITKTNLNFNNSSKKNCSFGLSSNDNYAVPINVDKVDIAVGITSGIAYGGLLKYLYNKGPKNYEPLIISKSLNVAILGLFFSNFFLRKYKNKTSKPE